MDESWRMRMGMPPNLPNYPPRRSADESAVHRRKHNSGDSLNPDDFTDVFGGPPRTVLSRQFSTGLPRSSSSSATNFFYEEVFRPPEKSPPVVRGSGRSLPEFMIPGELNRSDRNQRNHREHDGFYSDIFGWDDERLVRSRSRSKASSSSVLSSEELSPLRPASSGYGNDDVSFFASKLRPINVGSKWNSTRMGHNDYQKQKSVPSSAGSHPIYNTENECLESFRNYPFGVNRRNASPETISLEPISNGSTFRVSGDDLELNSPASVVSSVCQSDREEKSREIDEEILRQEEMELEDDETMGAYVIEISSDYKEGTCESNGIDEAIAWAKEKFQTYCSESKASSHECEKEKTTEEKLHGHQLPQGHTESFISLDEQQDKWDTEEDIQQAESKVVQTEMQSLDEKIKLWSSGKGADIRLLLSTLHHILWPNSGWLAIPLTSIIESSQVKKAYQRARLCLHPDKLQQRGATLPQKYIAEKAFSVLQDAWAVFNSHGVFCQ